MAQAVCHQPITTEAWITPQPSSSRIFTQRGSKKSKVHPITGLVVYRGSQGIALLILNLGTRRGWVVSTTPWLLYPQKRPGTHCTERWVGPRAGLDVYEKSRPHRDSIPRPSSP
jgi:hypothetical protein